MAAYVLNGATHIWPQIWLALTELGDELQDWQRIQVAQIGPEQQNNVV